MYEKLNVVFFFYFRYNSIGDFWGGFFDYWG